MSDLILAVYFMAICITAGAVAVYHARVMGYRKIPLIVILVEAITSQIISSLVIGTSTGERLITKILPLILWIPPMVAILNIATKKENKNGGKNA